MPNTDKIQITKDDITGAAARMQGYVALCGLGITRMRNHAVDAIPVIMNATFSFNVFPVSLLNKREIDSNIFLMVSFKYGLYI